MSNELLDYPERHYGIDHDRYEWSMLQDRKPVTWPDGKPLALLPEGPPQAIADEVTKWAH